MPINKTKSPLAKKYGQKRVVRARNLVQSRMGLKPGSKNAAKKTPWGIVGKIVQNEAKAGKTIKKSDISNAKKTYKKKGLTKSSKRYLAQSKKKRTIKNNVSRETSKRKK